MINSHNEQDKLLFIAEMGGDSPAHKSQFIQRRSHVGTLYTNFRKSSQGRLNWVRNKFNMMKGIRDYANSTESKKFHRQLGRWLATKEFIPKGGLLGRQTESIMLRSLLVEELTYYLPLTE